MRIKQFFPKIKKSISNINIKRWYRKKIIKKTYEPHANLKLLKKLFKYYINGYKLNLNIYNCECGRKLIVLDKNKQCVCGAKITDQKEKNFNKIFKEIIQREKDILNEKGHIINKKRDKWINKIYSMVFKNEKTFLEYLDINDASLYSTTKILGKQKQYDLLYSIFMDVAEKKPENKIKYQIIAAIFECIFNLRRGDRGTKEVIENNFKIQNVHKIEKKFLETFKKLFISIQEIVKGIEDDTQRRIVARKINDILQKFLFNF